MAAAPSMAAAIAASLPAPQAAPTQAAPSYEAIPASMSKVIDIEADIPVTAVQLDGMVSVRSRDRFIPSSPSPTLAVLVTSRPKCRTHMLTICSLPLLLVNVIGRCENY